MYKVVYQGQSQRKEADDQNRSSQIASMEVYKLNDLIRFLIRFNF